MRLTLRTLLAYLDDLLEPADAEQLGQKVEESEFAATIVNRINDCMRRLRLGVPSLNGRGMGGDPNTVAEYLDNTMAPDVVPEFERVCLESDMHLAEVAACHQIVTLVLREPADVDPESRKRMYLVARDPANAAKPSVDFQPAETSQERRRPQVPEYLRETEPTNWIKFAVAAAAVAIAVIVGAALFLRNEPVAQAPAPKSVAENPPQQPPVPNDAAKNAAVPTGEIPMDTSTAPAAPTGSDGGKTDSEAAAPVEAPPAQEPEPATPTKAAASETAPSSPASPATTSASVTPVTAPADSAQAHAETDAAPAATNGNALGRYVSEGQLLVRLQPPDDWLRLPARDQLKSGDQIVSLPDFHGAISLNSGVTVQLLSGTRIAIQPAESTPGPEIGIDFGRVRVLGTAQPNAKLALRVGQQLAVLSMSDPSSVAAVEVAPVPIPGADPTSEPGARQIALYVSQGSVGWQAPGATTTEALVAPAIRNWNGGEASAAQAADLPGWVVNEFELGEVDRRAAEFFLNKVTGERSARLSLTELANERRFEMKSLAVRSLALVDSFEPIAAALNESTQRGAWAQHIEILRMSIARNPEIAVKVRDAFEKRRPQPAADLFRMLAGYTEDQLRQGEAAKLVNRLESSDLDVRVLAIWNLEQISGESSGYRPHDPPNLRQPRVRRWKLWLQNYAPERAGAS